MTLPRGFRSAAEKRAASLRERIGRAPTDPIDLRAVAELEKVRIVSADELVERQRLEELERIQSFAFSACTFDVRGSKVIVVNPLRTAARQNSDIAHELAHLFLDHELTEIREIAGSPFRTCRPDQEEEATALGGAMLLPRVLLLRAAHAGMTIEAIARKYEVTEDMARWRYNGTGIGKQVGRRT